MSPRKPLDPKCNGSYNCPVEGHVVIKFGKSGVGIKHIALTQGQRATLRERRATDTPREDTND